jgi:hypothetical protein
VVYLFPEDDESQQAERKEKVSRWCCVSGGMPGVAAQRFGTPEQIWLSFTQATKL